MSNQHQSLSTAVGLSKINNSAFDELNNELSTTQLDSPHTECSWINCDDEELTNESSFIYELDKEASPSDHLKDSRLLSAEDSTEASPQNLNTSNKVREEIIEALKAYENSNQQSGKTEERPILNNTKLQTAHLFSHSPLFNPITTSNSNRCLTDKDALLKFNKTQIQKLWFHNSTEEETDLKLSKKLVEIVYKSID